MSVALAESTTPSEVESSSFSDTQLKAVAAFIAVLQYMSGKRKKPEIEQTEIPGFLAGAKTVATDFVANKADHFNHIFDFCHVLLVTQCQCGQDFFDILKRGKKSHDRDFKTIWNILSALTDPSTAEEVDFTAIFGNSTIHDEKPVRLALETERIFNSLY